MEYVDTEVEEESEETEDTVVVLESEEVCSTMAGRVVSGSGKKGEVVGSS